MDRYAALRSNRLEISVAGSCPVRRTRVNRPNRLHARGIGVVVEKLMQPEFHHESAQAFGIAAIRDSISERTSHKILNLAMANTSRVPTPRQARS
jgi:hypothetical protein